jgi:hypothetical protein
MRNARWTEKIPLSSFTAYMIKNHGYPANDTNWVTGMFPFEQPERFVYFADSIPLKMIRSGLRLRST